MKTVRMIIVLLGVMFSPAALRAQSALKGYSLISCDCAAQSVPGVGLSVSYMRFVECSHSLSVGLEAQALWRRMERGERLRAAEVLLRGGYGYSTAWGCMTLMAGVGVALGAEIPGRRSMHRDVPVPYSSRFFLAPDLSCRLGYRLSHTLSLYVEPQLRFPCITQFEHFRVVARFGVSLLL